MSVVIFQVASLSFSVLFERWSWTPR